MEKIDTFRQFVGPAQRGAIYSAMRGEESKYFCALVRDLIAHLETMPATYAQDGMGEDAVVHLHYFTSGADWYITEKDSEPEQHQAFGLADLFGDGGELGYISVIELLAHGAELDLHFAPRTLGELRRQRERKAA